MAKSAEELKRLTLREFNRAAAQFDNNEPSVYNLCRKDYPDILTELENEEFSDVLDAGCGTGAVLALLAEKYPEKRYTGIDLSPEMITVASGKNLPNVKFVCGDCEMLPFEAESFDVITCSMSFHHYPHPLDFFQSCKRVLRPGGRLIIRDMTANSFLRFFINGIELPLCHLLGKGDVACYGRKDLERFCLASGLKLEAFEQRKGFRLHSVIRKEPAAAIDAGQHDGQLSGVPETMLQTVYARAKETRTRGAIRDEKAVQLVKQLNYDFSLADKDAAMHNGVIARTIVLDRLVKNFLETHPGAVVVNTACGLDTRCYRMSGYAHWYNLDLPETMAVREKLLPEYGDISPIAMSAMEDWGGQIKESGVPVLVIIEGLTMYLTEADIRQMFSVISGRFRQVIVLVETMNPAVAKHFKEKSIEGSHAKFTWGVKDGNALAALLPDFRCIEEHSLTEGMTAFVPIYKVLGTLPFIRNISNKIIVLEKRQRHV
ncbi:methyltransferase domain-containing protein [Ligaoa zhengdingensis]